MPPLEKIFIAVDIVQDLQNKIQHLKAEGIKAKFLENLEFHQNLGEKVSKCIKAYSKLTLDISSDFSKTADQKPHTIKALSNRLEKELSELIHIIKDNYLSLEKANIISDILLLCQKHHPYALAEGFKGGHFIIHDQGKLYKALEKSRLTKERISSHYGKYKESGRVEGKSDRSLRAGKMFNELLFGITKNPKSTWFQLEIAPLEQETFIEAKLQKTLNNLLDILTTINSLGFPEIDLKRVNDTLEWIDYTTNHCEQKTIAQYGASPHTEKNNPIIITNELENPVFSEHKTAIINDFKFKIPYPHR